MDAEPPFWLFLKQIATGFSEANDCAIVELGSGVFIIAILTLSKRLAEWSSLVGEAQPFSSPAPMAKFVQPKGRRKNLGPNPVTRIGGGKFPNPTRKSTTA